MSHTDTINTLGFIHATNPQVNYPDMNTYWKFRYVSKKYLDTHTSMIQKRLVCSKDLHMSTWHHDPNVS